MHTERHIGLLGATGVGVGAIVGGGILALAGVAFDEARPAQLTAAQQQALDTIVTALDQQRHETLLLHGVTGSGKTEVYLRAVARSLEAGRQALILVPEISLTHQIVARLRARFGDALAVLHSGLRPSERAGQWQRQVC